MIGTTSATLPAEKIKQYEDEIVITLRSSDKYRCDLAPMIKNAAIDLVMRDAIVAEMNKPDFRLINMELSREGNPRTVANPLNAQLSAQTKRVAEDLRLLSMTLEVKDDTGGAGASPIMNLMKMRMS